MEKKDKEIFKYIQCIKNILNFIHSSIGRVTHLLIVHLNDGTNVE